MPTLRKGDEVITVSSQPELRAALADGFTPVRDTVTLTDPTGRPITVRSSELGLFLGLDRGGVQSAQAGAQQDIEDRLQAEFGGTAEQFRTFGERALGAASFSLTDLAGFTGGEEAGRRARANPVAGGIGTAVGLVGPALATGGTSLGARILATTPAGLAARGATAIAARGAGAGLGTRVVTSAAGFATEGALFGAGDFLSRVALEDTELSAEGFIAATGRGALFGGVIGGAFPLAGAALRAPTTFLARRLGRGTDEAGDIVETALARTPAEAESTTIQKIWPKAKQKEQALKQTFGDLREQSERVAVAADELDRAAEFAIARSDDLSAASIAAQRAENAALKDKWFNEIIPNLRATKEAFDASPRWRNAAEGEEFVRPLFQRADAGRAILNQGQQPLIPPIAEIESRQLQALIKRGRLAREGDSIIDPATGEVFTDVTEAIRVIRELESGLHRLAQEVRPKVDLSLFKQADEVLIRPMDEAIAAQADNVATQGARAADDAVANPWRRRGLDILTGIEAAQTLGLPLPDVDQIPVVGPLLGLYLKFRAVRALFRKGKQAVKATDGTRAAERVAKTRDRISDSLARFVRGAEAAAPAARRATLPTAQAILSSPLFDGRRARKADDSAALVEQRTEELQRAADNPMLLREHIRNHLPPSMAELAQSIEDALVRKFAHLLEHAPVDPRTPNPFNSPFRPSEAEIASFAKRVRAADDPMSVLEDLDRGRITVEAVETLKAVYPRLFAEMQQEALELIARKGVTLPYEKRVALSLVFDVVGDPSMEPRRLLASQRAAAPAPEPTQPPVPTSVAINLSGAEQLPVHGRRR